MLIVTPFSTTSRGKHTSKWTAKTKVKTICHVQSIMFYLDGQVLCVQSISLEKPPHNNNPNAQDCSTKKARTQTLIKNNQGRKNKKKT